MDKGLFITFEGIEGSGKTTQSRILKEKLIKEGLPVIHTFEPGGTVLGEKIREILLDPHMKIYPVSELLLYFAVRIQHVYEKIKPALEKGYVVICDRFHDSTLAYQGYGRGVSLKIINDLYKMFVDNLKPDLTILLDLPAEIGLKRNEEANKRDRFELEDITFHNKVKQGYLEIARSDPERFFIIDATSSPEQISESI
jgi:thymidylate kinase (EC 2.7.4.9)